MDRTERALLAQFDASGARQFEHRREGRRQRRTAKDVAAELVGKKRGQLAPFRHMPDKPAETSQRLVERMQRGRRDDQDLAMPAAMVVAVGAQKLVEAQLVNGTVDARDAFGGAAREDVPPEQRPRHQRRAGALHRGEQLQTMVSAAAISSPLGPSSSFGGSGNSRRDFRNASHAAMTR